MTQLSPEELEFLETKRFQRAMFRVRYIDEIMTDEERVDFTKEKLKYPNDFEIPICGFDDFMEEQLKIIEDKITKEDIEKFNNVKDEVLKKSEVKRPTYYGGMNAGVTEGA